MSTKQAPTPGELGSAGLFKQLQEVVFLFRSKVIAANATEPHSVAGMEFRVLRFFDAKPGATQADLVRHSGRDKGQIARLVAALVERGLLERDSATTRRSGLKLTAKGAQLQRQLQRQRLAIAIRYARSLTAEEQRQLNDSLQKAQSCLGRIEP